ncbi:DUF924 family protein, partial [Sulfitobacter sp. 15WGC]|uniref:DUF924 family protein n=1 Tax=Sulfitobacter sp. 15WGC TaxID=2575437 RepID=UPI00200A18E5
MVQQFRNAGCRYPCAFEGLWDEAQAGKLNHWLTNPTDALAFLILTDQFPRNMFRDTGK